MSTKKYTNPFYILLLLAGIVFAVSACAYGVMTVSMLDGDEAQTIRESQEGLNYWMDQNGFQLLMIELVVLGIATFAAIGTDDFWRKLAKVDDPADGETISNESAISEGAGSDANPDTESVQDRAVHSKSDD